MRFILSVFILLWPGLTLAVEAPLQPCQFIFEQQSEPLVIKTRSLCPAQLQIVKPKPNSALFRLGNQPFFVKTDFVIEVTLDTCFESKPDLHRYLGAQLGSSSLEPGTPVAVLSGLCKGTSVFTASVQNLIHPKLLAKTMDTPHFLPQSHDPK